SRFRLGMDRRKAIAGSGIAGKPLPLFPGLLLTHDREPLRSSGDPGIKPSLACVAEGEAFVEQHHLVPLRALRLVDCERVAEIEIVVAFLRLPGDISFRVLESSLEKL